MITLTVTDETIKEALEAHLKSLFTAGKYDNPVVKCIDNILGYSSKSPIKEELTNQVNEMIATTMKTPEFAQMLGQAFAAEMAKREVDKLKR